MEARLARTAPAAPGGVLFFGSSSIRLWNLERSFPELRSLNAGFGGSRIADCHRYAARLVHEWKPRTVVFYAGDNDLAEGRTPAQVLENFVNFVKVVRSEGGLEMDFGYCVWRVRRGAMTNE